MSNAGTVIALYTAVGTIGSLACTWLGDIYGRRIIIFGATLLQATGALLMGTSWELPQFIVARIVLGIGSGGVTATVSAWQTELSKAHSRGSHVSAFGVFCGIGLALGLWLDLAFSPLSSSLAWRLPLLVQIAGSVPVLGLIFVLPESPRWLVKKGRISEAHEILTLIYTDDDASADPSEIATKEVSEINASMSQGGSLRELLKMGPQRVIHRVCLGVIVQMFFQISGISAVTAYASTIYQSELSFSPLASKILAASSQFIIIIGSLICSYTVDRYGRRTLMLISASAMSISMIILSVLLSDPGNPSGLKAAVFILYFYYLVYTVGFLGIPFLYASEIAPSHLRAACCAISTASSWLFNFLINEVTPVALSDISWRYFIVFAAINAVVVPVVYFGFPETAGRQLEEIDEIFMRSRGILDPVRIAKQLGRGVPPEELGQGAISEQVSTRDNNEKNEED